MTIAYSKTEINKLKYSGLFSMVLIIVCTYFVVRDREVAVFISALPILIVILARLMRLFLFLLHYKTEETTYLELGEDTLTYHSVLDGKISIDLEQIRDIHMEEDGIFIDTCSQTKGRYKIPMLAEKEELCKVVEIMKDSITISPTQEQVDPIPTLCGRYIVILTGTLWWFMIYLCKVANFRENLLRVLLLVIVMYVLHKRSREPLHQKKASTGIFFRCVCCSMLIAQYILCACQIQEIVNKSAMDLSVSFQSLIAISVLYIGTGILFFPSKGLGMRMIQYNIHRHNNP